MIKITKITPTCNNAAIKLNSKFLDEFEMQHEDKTALSIYQSKKQIEIKAKTGLNVQLDLTYVDLKKD